jgi:predicted amidohydrolase
MGNFEWRKKVLTIFEASWGKFGIQICYDVEFPIGSQLLASEGAQLIVAPSAPKPSEALLGYILVLEPEL